MEIVLCVKTISLGDKVWKLCCVSVKQYHWGFFGIRGHRELVGEGCASLSWCAAAFVHGGACELALLLLIHQTLIILFFGIDSCVVMVVIDFVFLHNGKQCQITSASDGFQIFNPTIISECVVWWQSSSLRGDQYWGAHKSERTLCM